MMASLRKYPILMALVAIMASSTVSEAQGETYYMRVKLSTRMASKPVDSDAGPVKAPSTGPALTYAWERGDWSPWSSTCSQTATRSRSVTCRASDGSLTGDAACTQDAMRSETRTDMSGCSNRIQYNDAELVTGQYCTGSVSVKQNVWCVNRYGGPEDMSVCGAEGIPRPPATIDLPCSRSDRVTGDAFWSNGVAPGSTYRKGAYQGRLSESEATVKALAQCNASDYLTDVRNHGFCYFMSYTWVPSAGVTIVEAGPKNSASQGSAGSYDMTGSVTTTLNRFNTMVHEFTIDDRSMSAFQRRLMQCGQNFQVAGDYVAAVRCTR